MSRRWLLSLVGVALMAAGLPWGMDQAQATNYANSPIIQKFIDPLPGIPVATTAPLPPGVPNDGDYYEIDAVQTTWPFSSSLPATTKVRGYVQHGGTYSYLGPMIVAQRDRPVRLKFTNLLPAGTQANPTAGNLFLPVDTNLMGAGMGPDGMNPYTQNRTSLHLHGGVTPWISDGTAHQWITPAGETSTTYLQGVSQQNVPDTDMPTPPAGSETLYYTNQQSGRLMFYHDHAFGITRLNVYAGLAAPYLIHDTAEDALIGGTIPTGGTIPQGTNFGIPLVIQDKTFVDGANIGTQDPSWGTVAGSWASLGGTAAGDLWFPHVYEFNQTGTSTSMAGANPQGRWDYGPYVWPPATITDTASGFANSMGMPLPAAVGDMKDPSAVPEAFMDTMVVNGKAYPTVTVGQKSYRFRILNACNDRTLNLQLYFAANSGPFPATPYRIFWRDTATGQNAFWNMNGVTPASVDYTTSVTDPNWQVMGVGDFNGDGQSDLLWRNSATGENVVWYMNGATLTSTAPLLTVAPASGWQLVGVGDFNADGKPDLLWRNSATGQNVVWYMNGATIASTAPLLTVAPASGWQLVGVGDFNADGKPDLLWRNSATGENVVWYRNGVTITSTGSLPTVDPASGWQLEGRTILNNPVFGAAADKEVSMVKADGTIYPIPATSVQFGNPTQLESGVNQPLFYVYPASTPPAQLPPGVTAGVTLTVATPFDGRVGGVPDPRQVGPQMIQIGSEGGLLPAPIVLANTCVDYIYDRKQITFGNVRNYVLQTPNPANPTQSLNYPHPGYNLHLGPAERADVVVDFSSVPDGSTLILYNDGPAPQPGLDPRYDYYTGDPDYSNGATGLGMGGAPSTAPGFGPNTRTIMQIKVSAATDTGNTSPTGTTLLTGLQTALPTYFASNQDAPIVAPGTYAPIQLVGGQTFANLPVFNKTIAEDFDPIWGRMNAVLGTEQASTNSQGQQTFGFHYADPATELLQANTPQLWKITHNGVDTHAMHFHLFNVQVVNRVDWAGMIKPPDPNELGWKETVRMNPLEDIIVALQPKTPIVPFTVPLSIRPLDPTMPIGMTNALFWSSLPPGATVPTFPFTTPTPGTLTGNTVNATTNFGWEYVWHCHLLGHEENDMMRPIVFTP